jgi:hypothetical protein
VLVVCHLACLWDPGDGDWRPLLDAQSIGSDENVPGPSDETERVTWNGFKCHELAVLKALLSAEPDAVELVRVRMTHHTMGLVSHVVFFIQDKADVLSAQILKTPPLERWHWWPKPEQETAQH